MNGVGRLLNLRPDLSFSSDRALNSSALEAPETGAFSFALIMPVFSVRDFYALVLISGQSMDIGGERIILLYMKIRPKFTFRVALWSVSSYTLISCLNSYVRQPL